MFGKKSNANETKSTLHIFTIYDSKAQAYGDPLMDVNHFALTRAIANTFRSQPDNKYLVNAEDYQVFKIGEYSNHTGIINAHPPEHVLNLHELKATMQPGQSSGIVPT